MQSITLRSPAKLNFRLDVLSKRSDGYHELLMLMDRINLEDEIEIKVIERGIVITSDDPTLPTSEGNVAYRAAKEILAYSSRNVGVEIKINKRIPIASGMGGGSSNAAAVILGINQLLKLKLPKEKLMIIGAKIGADVPFFIFEGPAIASGIGDKLRKINKIPKMSLVLVNPGVPVSTQWAYKNLALNSTGNPPTSKPEELPLVFNTKKDVVKFLNNDLEKVTIKEFPVISEIKKLLVDQGAIASQMTGSGPTVFGIYPDKASADKAISKIEGRSDKKWKVFRVENYC
ncbi:MAG: 4-(cytidine 5'-diphospho)-2-C-methyl-D-erythritol kinase [Deltaproteobacteria bacterium]|nr:4-(cytidine 5'-diphospho)-2-C-methyl-D-erythritol kinase [Deltaproteobacteria bacterium]